MTTPITIFTSSKPIANTKLGTLPAQQLTSNDDQISFRIATTSDRLLVHVTFPAQCSFITAAAPGAFYEGLWEASVFELFLGTTNSESYNELHLAPHGAWWFYQFDSHRKRSSTTAFIKPKITIQFDSSTWSVLFDAPRANILPDKLEDLVLNASAVLKTDSTHYLSWNPMNGEKLDFHLASLRKKGTITAI